MTGEQRYPTLRFDDDGKIFNIDPNAITPELRAMLAVSPEGAANGYTPLDAYMGWVAAKRGVIAPLWEVQTARMQGDVGDPNAGLTEEERAAKSGAAAPLDTAYAAAHPNDPAAADKRVGSFMVVGLDLNHSGKVSTKTLAQSTRENNLIGFDWDGRRELLPAGFLERAANDAYWKARA